MADVRVSVSRHTMQRFVSTIGKSSDAQAEGSGTSMTRSCPCWVSKTRVSALAVFSRRVACSFRASALAAVSCSFFFYVSLHQRKATSANVPITAHVAIRLMDSMRWVPITRSGKGLRIQASAPAGQPGFPWCARP